MPIFVDRGDQPMHVLVPDLSDLLQAFPESVLKAEARFVSRNGNRTLDDCRFHDCPRDIDRENMGGLRVTIMMGRSVGKKNSVPCGKADGATKSLSQSVVIEHGPSLKSLAG